MKTRTDCRSGADQTQKVYGEVPVVMEENGCVPNAVTYNLLINSLSSNGRMEEACQLVNRGINKGISPINIAIKI